MIDRAWILAVLLTAPPLAAAGPRAILPAEAYDFGSVKHGTRVLHRFEIRSSGDAPLRLELERAELSQPGMKLRFESREIAPAASSGFTVEWNTEGLYGAAEAEARIPSNDADRPWVVVTLKGTVVPPVSIRPIPAVFLSVFEGEEGSRSLTLENNDEQPLAVSGVSAGAHFTASAVSVQPGKVWRLEVRSRGSAPRGRYDESLAVSTDRPDVGRIEIPLHLLVKSPVWVDQDAVDFGTVSLADARNPLLVQSLSVERKEGAFELTEVAADIPIVAVTSKPAGPSARFQIDVRLRPDALKPGPIQGALRLRTTDPRYSKIEIPIRGVIR
jgi:hypothetical protein